MTGVVHAIRASWARLGRGHAARRVGLVVPAEVCCFLRLEVCANVWLLEYLAQGKLSL